MHFRIGILIVVVQGICILSVFNASLMSSMSQATAWLALMGSFIASLGVFRPYYSGAIKHFEAWSGLIISVATVVCISALIHSTFGICHSSDVGCVTPEIGDLATGLYFSIVTFTTLGYGDYHPNLDARFFATAQALFGYVYLGLIVSAAMKFLDEDHN